MRDKNDYVVRTFLSAGTKSNCKTIKFKKTKIKRDLRSSNDTVLNEEYPIYLRRQHTLKWGKDILFVYSRNGL